MSNFDRIITAVFLISLSLAVSAVFPSTGFAMQAVATEEENLQQEEFSLDPEAILREVEEVDETLSRLVDKSTIADLEFLNSGESPASIEQLKAMQEHVTSLYERIEPAVVNIKSNMGQGSGVVVTSDGYILTAAHVISIPNRSAVITFPDGSRARAQTLGLFRNLDAGLLKIYEVIPEEEEEDEEEAEDKEEGDEESDSNDDEDSDSESEEDNDDEEDSDDSESGEEDSDEPETEESDDMDEEESDDEEDSESDMEEPDADEDEEGSGSEEEEADGEKEEADGEKEEADGEEEEATRKDRFAVQEDLPSFSYLEIGNSASLNLGQWVVAVGHPGGLDEDRGIVLRIGRINDIVIKPEDDDEDDEIYLRTDCTLVGGDSGGPLIGMDGSVIGIHSRIGVKLKLNFHVPSNEYTDNWTTLLEPVVHDRDPAMMIGFRNGTNVIASVPRRSFAARGGLKKSDRIIRIGDRDVYDKLQFEDVLSTLKPYEKVEFEIQRKGKKQVLEITIGEKRERPGFSQ